MFHRGSNTEMVLQHLIKRTFRNRNTSYQMIQNIYFTREFRTKIYFEDLSNNKHFLYFLANLSIVIAFAVYFEFLVSEHLFK